MYIKNVWIGSTVAAILMVASAPWWLNPYYLSIVTLTLIFIGFGSAWNIVGGMAGQFSIGHSLFVGLGGTVVGSLVALHGWNVWIAVLVSTALSGVLALLMSLLLFRASLPALSFALVTLALAEVGLLLVMSNDRVGAASGVVWNQKQGGLGIDGPRQMLWAALVLCIFVVGVSAAVAYSKLGFYLRATRDDESAAAAIGVNLMRTKTIALVISAVLTSIVATLYASQLVFLDPHQFASPVLIITVILYVVVGGLGTVRGPILGAGLLYPLGEILRGEFANLAGLNLVIFGVAIMIVVLYAPRGLSGLLEQLEDKSRRKVREASAAEV